MKYYDIYDEEIHDNDKVIASDKHGEISVGIFNNSKIFTDLGPINATHFINIVKVNNLDTVNNTVKDINKMYCKQLNSDVKEISVFDLEPGTVVTTKTGMQWLVLGEHWELNVIDTLNEKSYCKTKKGRLFINMKYIDKTKSLTENITNLMYMITNPGDALNVFKFSVPKAISIDTSFKYTENNIAEFLSNGPLGIVIDIGYKLDKYVFLRSQNFRYYNKVLGIDCINRIYDYKTLKKSNRILDKREERI